MSRNVAPDDDSARDLAVILLATGATKTAVAAEIGVDRRTIHRWLLDEDFAMAVAKARAEAFSEAVGVLLANARGAAERLVGLAIGTHDPDDDGRLRLGAITRLLSFTHDLGQSVDLEARITALEETHL